MDMTEESVFNRIPFRGIWWIMRDNNIQTDFFGEGLQFFLKSVVSVGIPTTGIAENQDITGIRIIMNAVVIPPPPKIVNDKRSRFTAIANGDKADVLLHIENAMRDNFPFPQMGVIMVICLLWCLTVTFSIALESPKKLLFLAIYTQNRALKGHKRNKMHDNAKLGITVLTGSGGYGFRDFSILISQGKQLAFDKTIAQDHTILCGI
jgi:hypothetical protein